MVKKKRWEGQNASPASVSFLDWNRKMLAPDWLKDWIHFYGGIFCLKSMDPDIQYKKEGKTQTYHQFILNF